MSPHAAKAGLMLEYFMYFMKSTQESLNLSFTLGPLLKLWCSISFSSKQELRDLGKPILIRTDISTQAATNTNTVRFLCACSPLEFLKATAELVLYPELVGFHNIIADHRLLLQHRWSSGNQRKSKMESSSSTVGIFKHGCVSEEVILLCVF